MKIFFDTEFTGLYQNCELISIGMVSENGKKFYAEIDKPFASYVSEWVREHVVKKLLFGTEMWEALSDTGVTMVHGTESQLSDELSNWLLQFDTVEFVSDVCHYDFMLLINIFGSAFGLPKNVCPACYDINQDIARYYDNSLSEAFDVNRESMVNYGSNLKHNALADAIVIKEIYNKINE